MVTSMAPVGDARCLPRRVPADARPPAPLSLDVPEPLLARAAPRPEEILGRGAAFSEGRRTRWKVLMD